MNHADFATLLASLDAGRVEVEGVGAFWQQARRTRVPGARQPVVVVPVSFHLVGEIRSIAYAQLLLGPGLREVQTGPAEAKLIWHERADKLPPLAFAEFALPAVGLFWTGAPETAAHAVGVHLLAALAREFPHPEWELELQFGMDMDRIFTRLAEMEYLEAAATLRGTHS